MHALLSQLCQAQGFPSLNNKPETRQQRNHTNSNFRQKHRKGPAKEAASTQTEEPAQPTRGEDGATGLHAVAATHPSKTKTTQLTPKHPIKVPCTRTQV
jgi:hypothetical protein